MTLTLSQRSGSLAGDLALMPIPLRSEPLTVIVQPAPVKLWRRPAAVSATGVPSGVRATAVQPDTFPALGIGATDEANLAPAASGTPSGRPVGETGATVELAVPDSVGFDNPPSWDLVAVAQEASTAATAAAATAARKDLQIRITELTFPS